MKTRGNLSAELEKQKQTFEQNADERTKEIYHKGIEALRERNIISNALNTGDQEPNFKLKNATGKEVELYEYLKKDP